jgi:hypothetical protein
MIKNKLILLSILILVMPLVLAETEIYPVNKDVDLKFTCTTNNAIPSNLSTFNITISYPNGTTFIDNKNTTILGNGAFSYTTNFPVLGIYPVQMFCYDSTYSYSNTGTYEITALGDTLSTSESIIYFIFLLASIGLFFLCLYYSVKIQWKHQRDEDGYVINVNDLRFVKIFTIAMSYVLLLSIVGLLRSITANYIPEIGVYRIFEWIYWLMLSGLYPIIVCSLIFALVIFISNKKLQNAIDIGVPIE